MTTRAGAGIDAPRRTPPAESDATMVSDPPGFGGPPAVSDEPYDDELADDPAYDTIDRERDLALDRLLDEDPPTNRARPLPARPRPSLTTDERAEEEPTRLDVGLVTPTPTPARMALPPAPEPPQVTPTGLATDRGLDDEDELLEVPTARQKSRARPVSVAPLSPIQEARNPAPAVSALQPRRVSRRTPRSGVPSDPAIPALPEPSAATTQPAASAPPSPDPAQSLPLVPPYPTPPPPPMAPQAHPDDPSAAPWAPQPEAPPPWPVASPLPYDPYAPDEALAMTLAPSRRGLIWWTLGVAASIAIIAAVVAMVRTGPPPPPSVAAIEVISIPAGATVKIDGAALPGVTPLTWADAQPGKTYRLVVELAKHESWLRDEAIPDNARQVKVIASLKPILGRLTVTSEPTGAEVFLNNRSVGHTPLTLPSVDPFIEARVEVRLRGHKPAVQPITWSPTYDASLSFHLTP